MTFVVGEDCIKCKHTDCVEVCPVDCFYEGPNFLVIHPDECIDCALCEPECPVDAIFSEDELPEDQAVFLELNAELAEVWPCITEMKEAPPTPKSGKANPTSWHCWNADSSTQNSPAMATRGAFFVAAAIVPQGSRGLHYDPRIPLECTPTDAKAVIAMDWRIVFGLSVTVALDRRRAVLPAGHRGLGQFRPPAHSRYRQLPGGRLRTTGFSVAGHRPLHAAERDQLQYPGHQTAGAKRASPGAALAPGQLLQVVEPGAGPTGRDCRLSLYVVCGPTGTGEITGRNSPSSALIARRATTPGLCEK